MLDAIIKPFKVGELRKRILFTLALIAIYRVGVFVPTPGVDQEALLAWFDEKRGTVVGFLDLFTGGAFRNYSIFALGIMPYISASIILQLLTIVVPYLERLSKEGEAGRRKINRYSRYLTICISIIQALGLSLWIQAQRTPHERLPLVIDPGIGFHLMTVLTMTTGTAFIMWLGEQITERGIGNGISLIIFASIVASVPQALAYSITMIAKREINLISFLVAVAVMILSTIFVIIMLQAHRRIPVQYAKRVVGRKVYGGVSTHIPLQINTAGVIPVIFASALLSFPATMATFFGKKAPFLEEISKQFTGGGLWYSLIYTLLIIYFTFFYTSIIFKPDDVAENMRKYGGFIPGIRPGKATVEHIEKILTRITFVGALFLAAVSLLPNLLINWFNVPFYFGGTALLIVVGVGLDTMKQIESHLLMRHYEGFIKKGKLRGRRG